MTVDEERGDDYHRTGLRAFLPLSTEDSPISTRGQVLPGLLQTLSSSTPHRPGSFRFLSDLITGDKSHETRSQRRQSESSTEDEENLSFGRRPTLLPEDRRVSNAAMTLMTPQMRSQRLIGNSNPRYQWERYFKTEEELKKMKKPIRQYYERNNSLIQQYLYIDKLLDSSLPHDLIQEYNQPTRSHVEGRVMDIPNTIAEEGQSPLYSGTPTPVDSYGSLLENGNTTPTDGPKKLKRTPKNLYRLPSAEETTPLVRNEEDNDDDITVMPEWIPDEDADSNTPVVRMAIYLNLAANTILLILKIIVTVLTSSVSVLASMVDAALDFLSTAIVWTTTRLISQSDTYQYPVGRRRLEPIGVLVFSVIMITAFFQVALEGFSKLNGPDHKVVVLTIPAIAIMAGTVVVKFLCWLWCRLINNSSVQALAQDALTDVVFNTFSIIFPLIGYFAEIWWLDPLGGILLAFYVIINWSRTTTTHIRNLTGAAASADERNVLLYLTMRFAKTVKQIQGLQAYHAGDKLNVEVDLVLDEGTTLRDSHDLGESLQYVLESVPYVDR
jgi:cation diffusion facilitator family transporter